MEQVCRYRTRLSIDEIAMLAFTARDDLWAIIISRLCPSTTTPAQWSYHMWCKSQHYKKLIILSHFWRDLWSLVRTRNLSHTTRQKGGRGCPYGKRPDGGIRRRAGGYASMSEENSILRSDYLYISIAYAILTHLNGGIR